VTLTRSVGAEEAGVFFLAYTVVVIGATLSRLGLDQSVVRLIAAAHQDRDWGRVNSVYATAVKWTLLSGALMSLSVWVAADSLGHWVFQVQGFPGVMQTLAFGVLFMAVFSLHAYALQGLRLYAIADMVMSAAAPLAVVALVLVWHPVSAQSVASYYLAGAALASLAGVAAWHAHRERPIGEEQAVDRQELWRSCTPLLVATVLGLIISWFPQLLLGALGSSADVAVFSAAQRIALLPTFFLLAVISVAAPRFAQVHQQGRAEALARLARNVTRVMLVLAVPAVVFMLWWPAQLLSIFGSEFVGGSDVLRILAVGQFVNVTTASVGYLLAMTGNERLLRDSVLTAAAVCTLSAVALVPTLGVVGAAVAAATGVSAQNLLCVWHAKKVLGFNSLAIWR
jgi:O-antigen/teichoic acid export membrane protein